jgi:serine/threonine protein kinase/tetratricopeptide (TPR) repeat protein
MPLDVGTRLGPYEIVSPIGTGGMGEVYKARDTRLDRVVALKVAKDAFTERFGREARAIAALNHPHICQLYDVGPNFLVMEFVEGGPIYPPAGTAALLDLAVQIADGLVAAHAAGVVHRDLKPANILVTRSGQVKILDFGIAMLAAPPSGSGAAQPTELMTAVGTTVGTVGYMSPEQARGEPVDARSDLWSFGVILYELATRVRPFDGATSAVVFEAVMRQAPVAVRDRNPKVLPELERIIHRLLEKDPDMRYQSAADARADLKRVQRDSGSAPVATGSPSPSADGGKPDKPWFRRHLGVAAAAALVLAIGAGLGSLRDRSPAAANGPETAMTAGLSPGAAPATGVRPDPPAANSIAVLPFVDLSERKDQEYFSDGLAEELLNLLAKTPQLQVIARTSSFSFKGTTDDIPTIARKLNVANVLEGSVRKAGNRLRVTTQLIRASTGAHIWSETYERELADVFQVQDDIAGQVVAALKLELAPGTAAPTSHRTSNVAAYEQYLIGRQAYEQALGFNYRPAADAFRRATELDPGYAAAYAELAMAQYNVSARDVAPTGRQQALAAAERAVALGPDQAAGYISRGFLRFIDTWDWRGALADYEKGLALNPADSVAQRRYSTVLAGLGRAEEAVAAAKRAVELDPLSSIAWALYGAYLGQAGQFPAAIDALNRARAVAPSDGQVPTLLGLVQLAAGDATAALAEFRAGRRDDPQCLAGMAVAEHVLGNGQASQRLLDEAIATNPRVGAVHIAGVYAQRGEFDQAFAWLDRALRERNSFMPRNLKSVQSLEPLRRDPRYAALLRKMDWPP